MLSAVRFQLCFAIWFDAGPGALAEPGQDSRGQLFPAPKDFSPTVIVPNIPTISGDYPPFLTIVLKYADRGQDPPRSFTAHRGHRHEAPLGHDPHLFPGRRIRLRPGEGLALTQA